MFVFADGCIYGHSRAGRKIEMMRANPSVCFEVDRIVNMTNWQSVIAWGGYEELHDEQAADGMERLLVRLGPLIVGSSSVPWHGLSAPLVNLAHLAVARGIVYRIRLTERSGRFERLP
jgi:nitroimidazol reductase NimA-like FMN-containing flavoprotein (pyridoxamine 5'-phosphate oxidase superfamily)